jgi:hypothetical protein
VKRLQEGVDAFFRWFLHHDPNFGGGKARRVVMDIVRTFL